MIEHDISLLGLTLSATLFCLVFIIIVHKSKLNITPFIKFVFVGGFNTLNYYSLYLILVFFIPYLYAHLIAFIYSAFVSYFLTSIFTFNEKPNIKTFLAFPITIVPNLVLSTLGSYVLVTTGIIDEKFASIFMMIIIIPVTFIISKIVFKNKKEKS
jgi:putative flippase GtrA